MIKKVVYQGVAGSFSHTIGVKHFGKTAQLVGTRSFKDIFHALKESEAQYGIIPIENTLAGSVYENYDLLYKYGRNVHVIAEYNLKIEHHLLGLPTTKFNDIKKVFSHPKALEQCDRFFDANPDIEEIVAFDTAGAAKLVTEKKDRSIAAIASKDAAKLYKLQILKRNIEDDHHNWTRFFVVGTVWEDLAHADKSSLIFSLSHKPGSLFRALKIFADKKINLTKIESRPMPKRPFEYFFYVDFEYDNAHQQAVKELLKELKKEVHYLKILGYYKKSSNGKRI